MRKDRNVRDIALAAIIIGIIVVMTAIPNIGFINFIPGIGITLIHIPVLIGAALLGRNYGLLFGFIFGIGSWILSFIFISTNAPFTNPLVSVIPRVFFGYIIGYIFELFKNLFKGKKIYVPVSFAVATFIHTVMVLVLLYFIALTKFYVRVSEFPFAASIDILLAIFTLNTLIEIGLAVVIGTPIFYAITHVRSKKELD